MDDVQAVNRILGGDKSQYETLVEKYKRMVYAIAWSHLGNSEATEDAAQETFISAYRNLGSLRDGSRFAAWLARIARNVSLSLGRARRDWAELSDLTGSYPSAEEQAMASSTLIDLRQSMDALAPAYREALTLFYLEGQSIRDASGALGMSEGAFRVRLHRARQALRQEMEERLAGSMATLEPRATFTHSVMSVLPIAPNSVLAAGGLSAAFTKAFAGIGFKLWMALPALFGVTLGMYIAARSEEAYIKDIPANRFRRKALRRNLWLVAPIAGAFGALSVIAVSEYGYGPLYKALTVFMAFALLGYGRLLKVNRSRMAVVAVITHLVWMLSFIAIGWFGVNPVWFLAIMGFTMVLQLPMFAQMPRRQDYSLFLRAATGGLNAHASIQPLARDLSMQELERFVMFLGGNFLAVDYQRAGNQVVVKLMPPLNSLTWLFRYWAPASEAVISPDGKVAARIIARDARGVGWLTKTEMTARQMEEAVSNALEASLARFASGDETGALDVLSVTPDSEIFASKRAPRIYVYMTVLALVCGLIAAGISQFVTHEHSKPLPAPPTPMSAPPAVTR